MPLFEVAILDGKSAVSGPERLVFGPKVVVADNRDAAIVVAVVKALLEEGARSVQPSLGSAVSNGHIEVLVRPFAGCHV